MNLIINAIEEGLLFSIVSMGVYITYKILDFPDLSVDGTYPLGAAITAVLLVNGVNPWLAIITIIAVINFKSLGLKFIFKAIAIATL